MGWEGANVIFDTWVHPLMMGLEEHLLQMFQQDFEFGAGAGPSHLGAGEALPKSADDTAAPERTAAESGWTEDALAELQKIPFFVRRKARQNTERFASERGVSQITVETLYDAKAHFAR
jgi:light-independent protochlorophyllide reductase subunit B